MATMSPKVRGRTALQPMLDGLKRFGEIQSARLRDAAGGVKPIEQRDPREAEASKIVVKRKRFGILYPKRDICSLSRDSVY